MPGTITALVAQKKNPERVNVYLDGKFAFGLAAIEAVRLKRGQVLTDSDIERLQAADDVEKAREKALQFLSNRPRSEWEVRQNLLKAGYGDETIDRVLERLRGVALVDDAAFVRYWLDNRAQFKPRGAVALRQELRRKGVDREVIDAVLEESEHAEDQAAIQAALAKADRYRLLPRPEFAQKLGAYLARRGFDYETVREAVQAAWQAIQADESSTHFDELEE
ncbi:MAG TPA: RecX family transcriptional regulator [Anaerolineae bacterium]|nr:RecX family transcriptional regulator [Anaerolineae bacterium]